MRRYEIPTHNAYHDGTHYHCLEIDCFAEHTTLREIDRIHIGEQLKYIPILRCAECGATYFGLITHAIDAEEVIRQHAERMKRAEEERIQASITAAEMDAEAFYQEEERREEEQRKVIEEHESELAGDITIPNIIGEPQKRQPRADDSDSDIMLPHVLTV